MRRQTCRALGVTALLGLACGQALLTAPAGSTLRVTANPPFIPAHGGVSVITAVLVEPAGTLVPDGTVVQFFTTLGRIEEQGRTNDGVARVNLTADGRSGIAVVTAVSGGPGPAPSASPSGSPTPSPTPSGSPNPNPTPTPAPTPTPTPTPGPGPTPPPRFGEAEGEGSASVQVAIGTALPTRVILSASPARITQPRSTRITAIVLDANGNPVPNVPVFFTIANPSGLERLDSAGNPRFTDGNGVAEDILRTDALPTAPPRAVVVSAQTANGVEERVTVTVN
jgi:hypothetical protein